MKFKNFFKLTAFLAFSLIIVHSAQANYYYRVGHQTDSASFRVGNTSTPVGESRVNQSGSSAVGNRVGTNSNPVDSTRVGTIDPSRTGYFRVGNPTTNSNIANRVGNTNATDNINNRVGNTSFTNNIANRVGDTSVNGVYFRVGNTNTNSNIANRVGAIDSTACLVWWDPVCGIDNQTYSNRCFARQANMPVWYGGQCVNAGCSSSFTSLVCGYDNQTYLNPCFAFKNGTDVRHQGSCVSS